MTQSITALTVGNVAVRQHAGLFSLNDLHQAAGGEEKHRPNQFIRNDQAQALIAELKAENLPTVETVIGKGKAQGTYACRELVIAYAAWISAAFHLEVIRVFLAVAAPQPEPVQTRLDYDRISPAQAQDLKELVHAIVEAKAQTFAETWARLHKKFKVNSYLELPATRFEEAREYLQGKMPPPTSYLRATVKKVGRYENGDWGLYVASGDCGFGVQVGKKAMRAGGVKPGDLIRLEYLKKDNPLTGPFTRVILWDEYKAPTQVGNFLPEAQAKEITERLDRLGKLFNPLSQPFNDVMGVLRALRGLHPVAPMPEPGYRQLLPRLA